MPTDLFEKVDVSKIAEELHLTEEAEEAAKRGLPALDSPGLDNTENEIVRRIGTYQSNAKDRGDRQLASYRKRLIDLEFHHSIDSEIRNSKAQLKEEVESARTNLREKKGHLKRAEERLINFQKKNKLHRDANDRGKESVFYVLNVGILAVLFLIETLGNASFLAKGNELGLFGAYTEAIVISFANLGVAFLLGWRLITYCHHVDWRRKSVGILAAIAFVVFAFVFNLMVAHYREITGTVLDEGGQLAMSAFRENPLGLRDFQSWMLFCMGFLFAIISFIDGIKWAVDPYPGYEKVFYSYQDEYETYKKVYDEHEEALEGIFYEAVKTLDSIKQGLMGAEKERASILDGHRHVIKSYEDYLNHLERAGNDLLKHYREVNRARRDGEVPVRFNDKWEMEEQLPIDSTLPEELPKREEIAAIIAETTASVNNGEKELQKEYDRARADLREWAMHRLQTQTQ